MSRPLAKPDNEAQRPSERHRNTGAPDHSPYLAMPAVILQNQETRVDTIRVFGR